MRKPGNPFTDQEQQEIEARVKAITDRFAEISADVIRAGVILSIAERNARKIFDSCGEPYPEARLGHEYRVVNGRESEIAEMAARPLNDAAQAIKDQYFYA